MTHSTEQDRGRADVTIRYTAHDHIVAYTRLRAEAVWQATQAQTTADRMDAEQWIDSADRHLLRWQSMLDRQAPR